MNEAKEVTKNYGIPFIETRGAIFLYRNTGMPVYFQYRRYLCGI